MAKNQEDQTTGIDQLNDNLTAIEQKVQTNQRLIAWLCIAAAAVVCVVLIYIYAIHKPGVEAANNAVGQADITLAQGNDSLALEQYKQVAGEYGHDGGNRANLNAAILLYKKGNYEEALKYLEDYKPSDNLIGASATCLKGDCYVNLQKYEEALKCFKKAEKISDENPSYTPYFIMKQANVYRELKDYKEEAECYEEIIEDYPAYGPSINVDMQKYLDRAKAQAEGGK